MSAIAINNSSVEKQRCIDLPIARRVVCSLEDDVPIMSRINKDAVRHPVRTTLPETYITDGLRTCMLQGRNNGDERHHDHDFKQGEACLRRPQVLYVQASSGV